jgi:hypothetical protein
MIENDILELKEIESELISVDETLDDLSLVKFELVNDSHWGCLEMTLFVFGAGDPDIECPVYEIRIDTDVLLTEQNGLQGISCQKLAALFAEDLIHEISGRNIPVICNEGDKTETYFDLAAPGNNILLPMIR